jgi:hypothetical protein
MIWDRINLLDWAVIATSTTSQQRVSEITYDDNGQQMGKEPAKVEAEARLGPVWRDRG